MQVKKIISNETIEDLKRSKTFEKMKYEEQLKHKQELVNKLFFKNRVEKIIANPKPKEYRYKAVLSATNQRISPKLFKIQLGLYEEGTKLIKPNLNHFIHEPELNNIFQTIEKLFHKYKIKAYHPNDRSGIIKHVLLRKSYAYEQIMVVFVTMGFTFPNHKSLIRELIELHPKIKTVVQNVHEKETHLVLLDKEKVLYGDGYLVDRIDRLDFRISAKAFYQVNPEQMIKLYHEALKLAAITNKDVVMDAYCGIGTLSLLAAKKAKTVIGVDINKTSINDAYYNQKLNDIENIHFFADNVDNYIANFSERIDVLIMDPAREGSTKNFLDAVKRLKPKRIVYISCDPITQIRDLKYILDMYVIRKVQPVDMFSYTAHIENIVLLELRK